MSNEELQLTEEQKRLLAEIAENGFSDEDWAEIRRRIEEDDQQTPKCFCGLRCDPPMLGDGKRCNICISTPTAEDMQIIVY